jgi:D-alanine-D-alanine ligase
LIQRKCRMRIGLSYDLKETVARQAADDDALEEYDSPETVALIAGSLEAAGHAVTMLGGGRDFLGKILDSKVDLVFNIAEGRGTYRSREAQVPSILEMLGIPYSGSDPECLAICLDKPLAKRLIASAMVKTPNWRVVSNRHDIHQIDGYDFSFPAIVKPAYEGSSKGIGLTSVVEDARQASQVANDLLEKYHQPAMVEELVSGEEVTVGVIGNSPPKVLGIMRVLPRQKTAFFLYTLEVKRNYLEMVEYECPAPLDERVLQRIESASLRAFKALGCRDFARVDFRISAAGVPYFLEINPLPGLGNHSDLVIMAQKLGWSHQQLISAVLNAAVERYPQCVCV